MDRIIDWGFAKSLFPRFLAIEPSQIEASQLLNIVAFSSTFLRPCPALQTDRQYFTSCLSSVSLFRRLLNQSRMIPLAQSIKLALSASDEIGDDFCLKRLLANYINGWQKGHGCCIVPEMNGIERFL